MQAQLKYCLYGNVEKMERSGIGAMKPCVVMVYEEKVTGED